MEEEVVTTTIGKEERREEESREKVMRKRRGLYAKIRAVTALSYYTGILVVIRSPGFIVYSSTTPFTVLFFLFVIGGGKYLPYGVIGATISILVQAGLFLGADATFNRVQYKFQDFCVASPLSAVQYMIGLSMGEVTFSAPSLAILVGLLGYLHLISWSFPLALLVMMLAWILASSLGFFLSTFILQSRSAFSITSLVATLLTVIPPVFYPIEVIPQNLRFLAYLVPTTHLSILMQSIFGIQNFSLGQIGLSWAVLMGYTLFFLGLAGYKARWRQP
ncbi:MAG: ABC transporter permease [Nitrososphaerales archaeon]